MAGIPPNFGGKRQFLANPKATELSTVVGDMAALQLQLIDALESAISPAARNVVDNIAEHVRAVLAASDLCQAKEQSTCNLKPLTRLPAVEWGDCNDITNIRMHNVPSFAGLDSDTLDVVSWMRRIFFLAESCTLTFAAATNLLVRGSSGEAAAYIGQLRHKGSTLSQIVQQLEIRYSDLCTPVEACVKTNNMVRGEDEDLRDFIDRLRLMARNSFCLIDDAAARIQATDVLVESNIRRVLPTSVRNALEERVINRSLLGLPAFTAREIEKECIDLERRKEVRKTSLQKVEARQVGQGAAPHGNHQAQRGLPCRLSDNPTKRTVFELIRLANIVKGSCIQCGLKGHYMNSDSCALKDKILMDRACVKCGHGLHSADDCHEVNQRQYVSQTPQPAAQAN